MTADPDDVQDRLLEGTGSSDSEPPAADLAAVPAGVTHPARKGGRVTDVSAVAVRLTLADETLQIRDADGDLADFDLRFSDIVYYREDHQEINGRTVESLSIRHVQPPAAAVTTAVSVWDDAAHDRLREVVADYYRRQRDAIDDLSLSGPQLELLVRCYSMGGELDPSAMLSKSTAELTELFEPLRAAGLLRKGDTGVFLTGRGYLVVNEEIDDETM